MEEGEWGRGTEGGQQQRRRYGLEYRYATVFISLCTGTSTPTSKSITSTHTRVHLTSSSSAKLSAV